MSNPKYASVLTVGCRLNQTDTALIYAQLKKGGFEVEKPETDKELSVVIINTCSVTSSASQKSRQYARSIKEKHPSALVIVTGCDIEVDKEKWEEVGVDIAIPNSDKTNVLSYLKDKFEIPSESLNQSHSERFDTFKEDSVGLFPFKSRANLKIQDGCDSFCTYCIVPYGRGKPRSREWNDTLREFRELVEAKYSEIVLTGVNIATYNDNNRNLVDLIEEMVKVEGNFRIRLGSTEPQFSMNGLLEMMASSEKLCRFLHLPLQHGSNKILKVMGRNYLTEDFFGFIQKAVNIIPDICLGSDVIVGFPGETEADFEECKAFLQSLPLAYLHVFGYSKREGTLAATFKDQIPPKISALRHKSLSQIGIELSSKFLLSQKNKIASIIPEKASHGIITGWTDNYIKVNISVDEPQVHKLLAEPFLKVKLLRALGHREMTGELL